ncbi:aldose 1-epimerase family protein [Lentilactobacillus sp. SPB1-3]|uniref:Aldose 1-epimerase family protein n=1 Tax=Lentilactobacillus terminaliae TaxID=3003483 RepID=A0ACD5DCQ7_9LACO|nr:aldose 1-epimerase family protein [Lentilactobacillus sp. SPB1-3]MCZ0977193.1 aldose 1-epimerase family protein [Lentilactobacillus sp. SPB1-3]
MIRLTNDYLTVLINPFGAELTSVKSSDTEYIWTADKQYWGRHAPILFPIVGRLKDNQYQYQGETYQMTQHGFARDNEFQVDSQTDDQVTLSLTQNSETLAKYPFKFKLTVKYELRDHELSVSMTVTNIDEKEMIFQLGAHPGFNVPFNPFEGGFDDYHIRFAPQKDYTRVPLKPPYSDPDDTSTVDLRKPVELNHELFNQDAQVFELDGEQVTLLLGNNLSETGVSVHIDNAKYVGVWSPYPKESPFVCIEPWWGLADTINADGNLEHKFATNRLAPQDKFTGKYEVTFF